MSRADYAHWNEEADLVWWQEEGRHNDEPDYEPPDYGPADAFADELTEEDDPDLVAMYLDADYLARWPHTKPIIKAELDRRGITVR